MPKQYERGLRIGSAIQRVIADSFTREFASPSWGMLSVTAVKMSPDMSHAKVYIRAVGSSAKTVDILADLNAQHGYFRKRISQAINGKKTPSLRFVYDESIDYAAKMEKLIDAALSEDQSHH
jgi:ribosome-binding factor A